MPLTPDDFAVNARKPRPQHPKGYEPGFEWDGRKGTIVADPTGAANPPQFETLLAELCEAIGEDPADYAIVGNIQVRRWQQTPGDDYLYYHRATISRVGGMVDGDPDVDALLARVAESGGDVRVTPGREMRSPPTCAAGL